MSRLLRREHPSEGPFVEGYFAGSSDRVHLSVGPAGCYLRLSSDNPEADEKVAEIPRLHAEALLNVCVGKLGFARTRLSDTPAIHVDHIIALMSSGTSPKPQRSSRRSGQARNLQWTQGMGDVPWP